MSSDLVANLLDSKLSCKIVVVKEVNNCDSSFIVSSLMSHWIKNKLAVLIISTHHSLQHYQHVGLKMNYNLQKYIDSGLIQFYNLGYEIVSSLLKSEQSSLEQHLLKLMEKIYKFHETHNEIKIVFDGVSHLFDLNFTLNNVNKFCSDLIKVSRHDNSSLFFNCNVASEDDVTSLLANSLTHKASTILEVEHLQSGLSADVSGHIVIKHPECKYQEEHMFILEQRPTKYLFKLFDRGVKLFAPGTV